MVSKAGPQETWQTNYLVVYSGVSEHPSTGTTKVDVACPHCGIHCEVKIPSIQFIQQRYRIAMVVFLGFLATFIVSIVFLIRSSNPSPAFLIPMFGTFASGAFFGVVSKSTFEMRGMTLRQLGDGAAHFLKYTGPG